MLSPDRAWFWDGQAWRSAVSPDGRWRWDGTRWAPSTPAAMRQVPTELTHYLQVAVSAYVAASVLYVILVLPGMFDSMSALVRSGAYYGSDPQAAAQVQGMMQTIWGVASGVAIGGSLIWAILLLAGTWLRWRWLYYALMVMAALTIPSILEQLALLLAGPSAGPYSYMSAMPLTARVAGLVLGACFLALGVWLFTAWRKCRTAWGMRLESGPV